MCASSNSYHCGASSSGSVLPRHRWISKQCAFQIGRRCQEIAVTPDLLHKPRIHHLYISQDGLQQHHAGVVEVCAPQLAVQRCKASSCVAITAVADLLPWCGPRPHLAGALLSRSSSRHIWYLDLCKVVSPPGCTPVPVDDCDPAAGVDRQQQLLASARHAAGGLLAGLAAATVSLSAGPAGAEVRMPPIDRNGEAPRHHEAALRASSQYCELCSTPNQP